MRCRTAAGLDVCLAPVHAKMLTWRLLNCGILWSIPPQARGLWVWHYAEAEMVYELQGAVRLRVKDVRFPQPPPAAALREAARSAEGPPVLGTKDNPFAPMQASACALACASSCFDFLPCSLGLHEFLPWWCCLMTSPQASGHAGQDACFARGAHAGMMLTLHAPGDWDGQRGGLRHGQLVGGGP